jgi:hypothetical protein
LIFDFFEELSIRLITTSSIILDLLLEGTILGSVFELLLGQISFISTFKSNIYLRNARLQLIESRLIRNKFPV